MKNKKMKETNDEKLTPWRLFSNLHFIIKEAKKLDRKFVYIIYLMFIVCLAGYSLVDTYLFKIIIDMVINTSYNFKTLFCAIGGIIGISVIANASEVAIDSYAGAHFIKLTGAVREKMIKKASDIDLICYDNKEYFDDFVIAASQSDEMIFKGVISVARFLGVITGILVAGGFIMTINPIIGIIPVAGFLINMVTRFTITKLEYNYEIDKNKLMRKADYSRRVFYQPEYAKEIKLSSIDIPLRKQFNEAIDEIEVKADKVGKKIAILSLINWITVYTITSYLVAPLYLAYLVLIKNKITFGDMASVSNAQNDVRDRLDWANYIIVDFQKVGQFAERFRRFMDYKIQIENSKGTVKLAAKDERKKSPLVIEHMSFAYPIANSQKVEDKIYTLKDISMTIHPGEHIAIVGENGAGKSTFIKLLMRLYDVTEGRISYNGHDIRDYSTKEYRSIFGAVFQDFQLYGADLAENVLMDKRINETDNNSLTETKEQQDKRIKKALELADFTEKFNKLEHGLDTQMTREFCDEGTMLSGGESQKVAISRMFAKNEFSKMNKDGTMSIAILDEPSSALDPQAEYILNKNMLEAAGDAAVIFISHRLSTTLDADRIYLFENGQIVEQGTHEELMSLNGSYASMFEKQAHYYQQD